MQDLIKIAYTTAADEFAISNLELHPVRFTSLVSQELHLDASQESQGRARMPASMLPTVARLLTLSLDELMAGAAPAASAAKAARTRASGKRGPASRLQQQIDAIALLPKTQQQFVSQMLDTVLGQGAR